MPGNDRRHASRSGSGDAPAKGGLDAPGPEPRASLPGNPDVIRALNAVLTNELTAINQYFLHSRMLADWGLSRLAKAEYDQSIDEMKDADKLIDRILFLGGLPNLQDLDKLLIGENVREILECDLRLEQAGLSRIREAIAYCEGVRDFVTRDLFSDMLDQEEGQVDFIETQFELIDRIGLERYIQLQSGSAE